MVTLRKIRRAAEKLIAPYGNVTYAQSGEDMILDFLVGHKPLGFYVDVGCNHPLLGSNTYRFYRKGWRGICIDANPKFMRAFRKFRPRDAFVQACISDKEEDVEFHFFAHSELSSISGKPLYDNDEHYRPLGSQKMRARPLHTVLAELNAPQDFDILSVDVEGHDEAVVRSLGSYRPKVIVAEFGGAEPLDLPGYERTATTWSNAFYVASG